jgi:hypothetical protein
MNEGQIVIDVSMLDFDPTKTFFKGEYTKIGAMIDLNFSGKHLYVCSPYGQVGDNTVKIAVIHVDAQDTMTVTAATDTITIKMAYTTAALNAANLIQVALRLLGDSNSTGVDVSAWTVTENAAYAASRPTGHSTIAGAVMTNLDKIYQNILVIATTDTVRANNTNYFPYAETSYWTEKTLGDPVEIVTPYLEAEVFDLKGPQSADTLYIFHELHPSMELVRHSHINWELKEFICLDMRAKAITDITNDNPAVITCPNHNFVVNDWVIITGVEGMTEINGLMINVGTTTTNGFNAYGLNTNTFAPYKSGGYVQMSITGISKHNPAVVTMAKHGFEDGDIVYISNITGMVELNNRLFTVASRTNTTFELLGEDSTSYTTFTSGGRVDIKLFCKAGDYPSCGAFFEQRLYKTGAINHPQTVYGSVVSDFDNHTTDPDESDAAIEYTIPGALNRVDRIRWMIGEDYLLLGTSGSIQKLGASSIAEALTQTNVSVKSQVGAGAANVEPQAVIDSIIWLQRAGRNVRQLSWNYDADKYLAPSMTRIAEHITLGATDALSGIKQMAFQMSPVPILWCVRNDGQLLGMTYEIQEQVYAWFRVVTDGLFESVAVISKDGEEDQVWVIVNRTIGGVVKRFVEYFTNQEFHSVIADAFFVHSGLTRTLTTETTVTIAHLANKDVDVMIAGVYIGRITANGSGVVALGATYSGKCHVGLPFTSTVEPMKLNAGSQLGTARGKKQKINCVTVCLYETCGGQIGMDISNLLPIDVSAVEGTLVTDDYQHEFSGDWKDEATMCIVQDEPYPMTVLGLIPRLSLNED